MAIALVNHVKKIIDNLAQPYVFGSFGFTPSAGNMLIISGALVTTGGFTPGVVSVTDSASGTWTLVKSEVGLYSAFVAWRENIPSGLTSVTVNGNTSAFGFLSIDISEWSGMATASAQDQTNGASGNMAPAAVSSGNITTTNADDLLLTAAASDDIGNTGWSAIGGSGTWTELFQESDSTVHAAGQSGYQIVAATGTYNSTQRYSIDTVGTSPVVIVALKAAGGAADTYLMAARRHTFVNTVNY